MNKIKLIVGLNNNDIKYNLSRHNVGAWYINVLSNYFNKFLKINRKIGGYYAQINIIKNKTYIFIPNTFMNLSGEAIYKICNFYKIKTQEILVVHDEIYLSPGIAKFKCNGGDGGHNGLKSIISKLGNYNFYRLRIGIGLPNNNEKIINFVLNKPNLYQKQLIDKAINEAVKCTTILLEENIFKAMNRLHAFKAY